MSLHVDKEEKKIVPEEEEQCCLSFMHASRDAQRGKGRATCASFMNAVGRSLAKYLGKLTMSHHVILCSLAKYCTSLIHLMVD